MNIEQSLEKYQIQLEADGRSPHTIAQYRRHIRLFTMWAHDVGLCGEIEAIDHEHIAQFLASPTARTRFSGSLKRATSTNCLRSSLRGFFRYCHEAGYTSSDPTRLTRRAICGTSPPRALIQADQDRLMTALAQGTGYEARRDHAMFHLMLATGIRLGSAAGLDTQDVDLDAGEISLRHTKGDHPERIYLGERIQEHLRDYLADRSFGPLFTDLDGQRLTTRQIQRRFKHWLRKAGIQRHASVHSLRHSFAISFYRRTGDIFMVQLALRHRSIMSTLVYAKPDESRLRSVL